MPAPVRLTLPYLLLYRLSELAFLNQVRMELLFFFIVI